MIWEGGGDEDVINSLQNVWRQVSCRSFFCRGSCGSAKSLRSVPTSTAGVLKGRSGCC